MKDNLLSDFPLLNSVLCVLSPRPLNEKSPCKIRKNELTTAFCYSKI